MKKYLAVVLFILSHSILCCDEILAAESESKSPHTFASHVSLVSDYRFRGISQTMRRPAIQGGFDYSHSRGIYLGTWASNVDGTTHFYNNTSMEWDFFGGYKGKVLANSIQNINYNVGLIYYYYPGGKTHAENSSSYNTAEFYLELSYKWLVIKYWQTFTNYFKIFRMILLLIGRKITQIVQMVLQVDQITLRQMQYLIYIKK